MAVFSRKTLLTLECTNNALTLVVFSIHIGSTDERNAVMLAHQTARHPKKNSYDTKAKVQVCYFDDKI